MSFRKPRRRPLPRHIPLQEATRNHTMKFARSQREVLRGEVEPPKRTSVVSAGGKYDAATVRRPCGMHIVAFLLLDALHPRAIRVDKQNLKADTAELGRSGQTPQTTPKATSWRARCLSEPHWAHRPKPEQPVRPEGLQSPDCLGYLSPAIPCHSPERYRCAFHRQTAISRAAAHLQVWSRPVAVYRLWCIPLRHLLRP